MNLLQDLRAAYTNWWIFLILGAVFLLLGLYVFSVPIEGFVALTFVFALGMLFDGFGDLVFSVRNRGAMQGWGWQMAIGLLSMLIGISLIVHPEISIRVLPLYIGFWILLKGLLLSGIAFELKTSGSENWWLVIILAGMNALFGVLMILNPLFGATLIGTFAALGLMSIGISLIYVGFRVKKIGASVVIEQES
jgi:uncharacterized membrane protein HdeD (DUF308 family)